MVWWRLTHLSGAARVGHHTSQQVHLTRSEMTQVDVFGGAGLCGVLLGRHCAI